MQPGTVALLVLGAAGAAGAYYFLVVKPRQGQQTFAVAPTTANTAINANSPASSFVGGDHVDRKNLLAPTIVNRFTGGAISTSTAAKVTSLAGKLDVSGYAERYVSTKVPVVGKIAEAPVSVAKSVVGTVASWF